jgi:dTMP kinase
MLGAQGLSPEAELLVIFAARIQHVREVIVPDLAAGKWVLSDRFTDASYAYQGGGRGIATEFIRCLEERTIGSLQPDLTLLLDAPVEIGIARARARGSMDRFECETIEFQQKIRAAYRMRAEAFPKRIRRIDASRSREMVREDIAAELERRFAHEF